ncbi:MAG: TIGR03986 family CRISPR-associated RAMP protein [Campylobacterales bacterium]
MITAPYNFVPLNKEVFYPEWSEQVSHDIPFSDGESGEIEITITAKSPIFIRNHSDNKDKPSSEFCHFVNENDAKEFYIPGSSFKGMVRSVLEIMSFSKISIDEERFKKPISVRDMTNRNELVGTANGCGFLINNGDSFLLEDCGKILTISHSDLQRDFTDIKRLETAKAKYEKYGMQHIKYKTYTKMMKVGKRQIPKQMAKIDHTQNNTGILVFTGDIGNKKHEFVFKSNGKKIHLDPSVIQDFKKAYFENEDSIDGQYWKERTKQPNTKIPIFYVKNKDSNKIEAIGLTQLFKLAYKKTILEAAKQVSDKNKLDLAETIFGTEKNKLALKGRVQFSHLKCTTERYEKEIDAILGSPNPTYYPNYIRQYGKNGKVVKYKTLMDSDAVISGWKRYPLHETIMPSIGGNDNDDVKSHFKPLQSDSVFKGKLRFHNLKKVEIGALLSAITFHGQSEKYMHNIGMAKPLGYGKISIKLTPKNLKFSQDEYLKAYQDEIEKKIPNWRNSPQLRELFAMASVNAKSNQELAYQLLENPRPKYYDKKGRAEKNDFTGAKKEREFLLPHSGEEFISKKPHQDKKPNNKQQQSSKANNISNLFGGEAKVKPQRKRLNIVKKGDKKS